MRDHAGGVACLARDTHDRCLIEAMLGDHSARHQRNLIATLLVIDDLGHGDLAALRAREGDTPTGLRRQRLAGLRSALLLERSAQPRRHGGRASGGGIHV